MKKQNVLNLIKYHVEKNENSFRNEAINIARNGVNQFVFLRTGFFLSKYIY